MVLVSALGAAAFAVVRATDRCDVVGEYTLAVSPGFAPVVSEVLDGADTECTNFAIEAEEPGDVSARLGKDEDPPDLWIPPGGWWAQWAQQTATGPVRTVSTPLATSPVVLVGAVGTVPEAASWREALGLPGLLFGNPLRTGAAAGALRAVLVETAEDPIAMGTVRPLMALLAQRESARAEEPPTGAAQIDDAIATGRVTVTTEQQVVAYREERERDLDVVVPATGSLLIDYPIVVTARDRQRHDAALAAASALADALHTPDALEVLARYGFRDGEGRALPEGRGVGPAPILELQDETVAEEAIDAWALMALPVRTIFAVDVSPSMDRSIGGETRIELVRRAAIAANDILPGNVSAGLWIFGGGLGADGRGYSQVAPIRRFDTVVDGRTHRDIMTSSVREEVTTGSAVEGTALYGTILEAYRTVQDSYDPRAVNSVVVVTDGTGADAGGVTRSDLLDALTVANDPARPVRIVTIGLGEEVDAEALGEISSVTGGTSYLTNDPLDLTALLVTALADRARR